jgi:hypothetical protein
MERPEVVAGERGEILLWENRRRRDESVLEPVCVRGAPGIRVNGSGEFFPK